jgi:hypothetical protein
VHTIERKENNHREETTMYKQPVTSKAVQAVQVKVEAGMRLRPALLKTCDEFDCNYDALFEAYEVAYPD